MIFLWVWITIFSSGKDVFLLKDLATMEECEARKAEILNTPLIDGVIRLIECRKR
jgi:hypothetical protein